MSSSSSFATMTSGCSSEPGQPGFSLGSARLSGAGQAGSDGGVVGDVAGAEVVVGRVPDLGRDLAGAQEALERLLVAGPAEQQPAGGRVALAVAEHRVEAPGHLVDELVHVALEAAVVAGGEDQPAVVVDRHPAGEVDGANPGEHPAVEDVAGAVVHHPEDG